MTDGPLIVQSDKTLLLETAHPESGECRKAIAPFSELERAPEHVHTYRLTPLGLWNARAAGHDAEQVIDVLLRYSRYPVPHSLLVDIAETLDRYGIMRRFPIMSVSLAELTPKRTRISDYAELASRAADAKKQAKAIDGSCYVRDGVVMMASRARAQITAS